MKQSSLKTLVENYFGFLLKDYGFRVIHQEEYPEHQGNALVVLESNTCRVRFTTERGQVFMDLGPRDAPTRWRDTTPNVWFDLMTVIAFLTNGAQRLQYDTGALDAQMQRLSKLFQPYAKQAFDLFAAGNFKKNQATLAQFGDKMAMERWGKYMSRQ
jgi:hypothetical protein